QPRQRRQLMSLSLVATTAEGTGLGAALVWLAIGLGLLAVFGSLAYLIGRDANRRGRKGWAWGLLFLWQPVIVGMSLAWLISGSELGRGPAKRRKSFPKPCVAGSIPAGGT